MVGTPQIGQGMGVAVNVCPACGYPTIDSVVCSACLLVPVATGSQPIKFTTLASARAAANLWPATDPAAAQAV
jgi:hypothetical protein